MGEPLGATANAVLDVEIDPEADKQRDEGGRDEIEATDHEQAERGRDHQADDSGEQHGNDGARRVHRQPQDTQHRHDHAAHQRMRILGQRAEFLVGQWNRAGQAHANPMRRIEIEGPGRRADGITCGGARLQGAVVHYRLNQNDLTRPGRVSGCSRQESAPREEGRLSSGRLFECLGQRRHLGLDIGELHLSVLDALQAVRERGKHASQAWIGGKQRQRRLRTRKAFRCRANVCQWQQQQAVAIEERTALWLLHGLEELRLRP